MPFVTTLTYRSGDRTTLERVVGEVKEQAERKGVELKGPRAEAQRTLSVPQHARLSADGGQFDPWRYTVYTRAVEVVGHDDFARSLADRDYPDGIHVDVEIEQQKTPGYRS